MGITLDMGMVLLAFTVPALLVLSVLLVMGVLLASFTVPALVLSVLVLLPALWSSHLLLICMLLCPTMMPIRLLASLVSPTRVITTVKMFPVVNLNQESSKRVANF